MILYIYRGLPGSGKSTAAAAIGCFHVEGDMYHVRNGKYTFDQSKQRDGHNFAQNMARMAMERGIDVAVSNTFTQAWEMAPYLDMAKQYGYEVRIFKCVGGWANRHNVPAEVIERMRARWGPVAGEIVL